MAPIFTANMTTFYYKTLEEALKKAKAARKRPGCFFGGIELKSGRREFAIFGDVKKCGGYRNYRVYLLLRYLLQLFKEFLPMNMNNSFDICQGLDIKGNNRKYYVYRLIDPRTLQTFYVGKGCGDRVFQHVKDARFLIGEEEDGWSLKIQQIADILACGKQVISVIHRRGLTSAEAFEVEAALIDAYPGLTNIQRGHDFDRGCINVSDLRESLAISEYSEPDEKYIIIKTTPEAIANNGSLYEATRRAWRADLSKAKEYSYVLAVVYGIVREVFKVSNWIQYSPDRIAFEGAVTSDPISSLKGKRIPLAYRRKGVANPFLYKK